MYEDTPQDLVHDLVAEAVFGAHPLGRPVIGTRRRDLDGHAARSPAFHRAMYAPGNIVVAAAGNLEHERLVELVASGAARRRAEHAAAQAARAPAARRAPARPPLPAQGHRAVPRLPRRARHRALRPAALRRLAARRDPRRLGVVAAVPGDPREARDGVLRLQLRLAVHRHRPGRRLRRHARGEPRRVPRDRRRASSPTSPAGTSAPSELERAKENLKGRMMLSMESTSNRMSRLGKSLITDTELLSLDRIVRRDRRRRRPTRSRARRRAARARAALGGRHRPERGALPRCRRARQPALVARAA